VSSQSTTSEMFSQMGLHLDLLLIGECQFAERLLQTQFLQCMA
jgi:hypothetical protein